MRIEARPVRWFSTDFELRTMTAPLTVLDLAAIRSRGEFTLGGEAYTVRPEGLLAGKFVLEHGGRMLARAERAQIAPLVYQVRAGDRQLHMHGRFPGRTFELRHGDRTIGSVRPIRLLGRGARYECSEDLPLPTAVFLIALALLRWRRRARGRSGG